MPVVHLDPAQKAFFLEKLSQNNEDFIQTAIEHPNVRHLINQMAEKQYTSASRLLFMVEYVMNLSDQRSLKYANTMCKLAAIADYFNECGLQKDISDYLLFESGYSCENLGPFVLDLQTTSKIFLQDEAKASQEKKSPEEQIDLLKKDMSNRIQVLYYHSRAGYELVEIEPMLLKLNCGERFKTIGDWHNQFTLDGYKPAEILAIASLPDFEARFEAIHRWHKEFTRAGYTTAEIVLIALLPDYETRFAAIYDWHNGFDEDGIAQLDLESDLEVRYLWELSYSEEDEPGNLYSPQQSKPLVQNDLVRFFKTGKRSIADRNLNSDKESNPEAKNEPETKRQKPA